MWYFIMAEFICNQYTYLILLPEFNKVYLSWGSYIFMYAKWLAICNYFKDSWVVTASHHLIVSKKAENHKGKSYLNLTNQNILLSDPEFKQKW